MDLGTSFSFYSMEISFLLIFPIFLKFFDDIQKIYITYSAKQEGKIASDFIDTMGVYKGEVTFPPSELEKAYDLVVENINEYIRKTLSERAPVLPRLLSFFSIGLALLSSQVSFFPEFTLVNVSFFGIDFSSQSGDPKNIMWIVIVSAIMSVILFYQIIYSYIYPLNYYDTSESNIKRNKRTESIFALKILISSAIIITPIIALVFYFKTMSFLLLYILPTIAILYCSNIYLIFIKSYINKAREEYTRVLSILGNGFKNS